MFSSKLLNNTLIVIGFLALIVLAFYGNTLANGFVHDDIGQVVRNDYVQSLKFLPKVVTGCIWEFQLGGCSMYYRPIQSLSYLLTWQISSQPIVFHIVNLLYFWGVAVLVFLVGKTLARSAPFGFVAAVIFVAHPINSEVVNWISAVPELSFTLFSLASLLFFLRYRQTLPKKTRNKRIPPDSGVHARAMEFLKARKIRAAFQEYKKFLGGQNKNLIWAAGFYYLAMLGKEPAVLLPALFLFLDVFVFHVITLQKKGEIGARLLPPYGLLAVSFAAYLGMRMAVLRGVVQGADYYTFTFPERAWAGMTLFAQYLEKLFLSYPLNFYYPFIKDANIASPAFILSLIAICGFIAVGVFFARRTSALLGFFFLWIAVFLLPVIIFLESTGENIFSERYLFASSIGFAYALSSLFMYLFAMRNDLARRLALGALCLIIAGSWILIFQRNKDWKDDFSLYTKTLEQNPDAHALRRNLAVELNEIGQFDEAIKNLEEILQRADPHWRDISKVYSNLGDSYRGKQEYERSYEFYQKALQAHGGEDYRDYNNIGANFWEEGKQLNALVYFCKAIALDPKAPEPNFNMNRAAAFFDAVGKEGLPELFSELTEGTLFAKSPYERILFEQESCQEKECSAQFKFVFKSGEIILPFLMIGKTPDGNFVRASNRSFDGPKGIITLTLDKEVENKALQFIFPTCEAMYYEAITTK